MPTDKDLFAEEDQMVSMSFGDHIEELRLRLILGLLGLAVGVIVTFLPGLDLGRRVMMQMQQPAERALAKYNRQLAVKRAAEAREAEKFSTPFQARIRADDMVLGLRQIAPELRWPDPKGLKDKSFRVHLDLEEAAFIETVADTVEQKSAVISLAPMETFATYFMVCIVTGLVLSSPWVFYQLWAFVAAGLYRHERAYVKKFLPFSLGLFLAGVLLCFFGVLPLTLAFLLEFNVWLGIEPTLRLSEWMGFASILPLVFGLAFQTPLVMLFLERLGILSVEDYRSKRRIAILVIFVAAAIITPTPDPFTMMLLAGPMIALYELGIFLARGGVKARPAAAD